jgi:hypothetical protein
VNGRSWLCCVKTWVSWLVMLGRLLMRNKKLRLKVFVYCYFCNIVLNKSLNKLLLKEC